MPDFGQFASTKDLIEAHDSPSEGWFQVDEYRLAGRMMRLYKSDWGRYQVVRDWLEGPARALMFTARDHAIEVFDANQRLMDRKWFSDQPTPPSYVPPPTPAGYGRFG